jgi:hypothetical protein
MLSKRLPRQGQLRLLGCRWRDVTEDEGRPPVVQAARSRHRRPEAAGKSCRRGRRMASGERRPS